MLRTIWLVVLVGLFLCSTVIAAEESVSNEARLHKAAKQGDLVMVRQLLDEGLDVDLGLTRSGATALHAAAFKGRKHVVKFLIERGANVNALNNSDFAPIHLVLGSGPYGIASPSRAVAHLRIGKAHGKEATAQDRHATAYLLIKNGANVNLRTEKGLTPLHIAASKGDRTMAFILLSSGAKVDEEGPDKVTPLQMAAAAGHVAVARLLIRKQAKVNRINGLGYTALHHAAEAVNYDLVQALLKAGADTTIKNKKGQYAVVLAELQTVMMDPSELKGHENKLIDLLLEHTKKALGK